MPGRSVSCACCHCRGGARSSSCDTPAVNGGLCCSVWARSVGHQTLWMLYSPQAAAKQRHRLCGYSGCSDQKRSVAVLCAAQSSVDLRRLRSRILRIARSQSELDAQAGSFRCCRALKRKAFLLRYREVAACSGGGATCGLAQAICQGLPSTCMQADHRYPCAAKVAAAAR